MKKRTAKNPPAAQRSLAASKANWTRKRSRAFAHIKHAPETLPTHVLQYALARRAWERGECLIVQAEESLAALRKKQIARQREMALCADRELDRQAKGGAL